MVIIFMTIDMTSIPNIKKTHIFIIVYSYILYTPDNEVNLQILTL